MRERHQKRTTEGGGVGGVLKVDEGSKRFEPGVVVCHSLAGKKNTGGRLETSQLKPEDKRTNAGKKDVDFSCRREVRVKLARRAKTPQIVITSKKNEREDKKGGGGTGRAPSSSSVHQGKPGKGE